jgi:hypothetical protein
MAKTTTIVDDLDGSANAETVEFSLGSNSYSIDLSKKNRAALEKALKPYIDSATKVGGRGVRRNSGPAGRRGGRRTAAEAPRQDLGVIRAWAQANGYEVSDRGRVAAAVVEAYNAAR